MFFVGVTPPYILVSSGRLSSFWISPSFLKNIFSVFGSMLKSGPL